MVFWPSAVNFVPDQCQKMETGVITTSGTDIGFAAELLRNGELVAIPTETVYGLAGNALDEQAVRKIYTVKNRPLSNPLILHVSSADQLTDYCAQVPDLAYELLKHFSPGPITLLLPRKPIVPAIVTAGLPDLAIRIPKHPLTLELLSILGIPLAAPSANPFGYISPTTAGHVNRMLTGKIKYILDGGPCHAGIESTIVGFPDGVVTLYRQGAISREAIEKVIGPIQVNQQKKVLAPGMMKAHYQPNTPFILCDDVLSILPDFRGKRVGLILFDQYSDRIPRSDQWLLSEQGDMEIAASRLYATLHEMDEKGFDVILAQRLPDTGLGVAINDRLQRAAAK